MAVTESGHVSMEIKSHVITPYNNQVEITKELVRVSPDGKQIQVYRNTEGNLSVDDRPTSCQPDQVYMYPNLPDKLWKKYQHAHKFVELIKSRTPRVILVTDKAQCKLMENSPHSDFQVYFHEGVTLMLSKSKVTLTDKDGSTLTFNEDMTGSHVSQNTLTLLEYSQQCRDQCLMIDKSVSDLQSASPGQDLFPIIVGTNSQQCLLSSQPSFSPLSGGQTSSHAVNHSQDPPNQVNIQLPLNLFYTQANTHKLPVHCEMPNALQCEISECESPQTCSYIHNNEPNAEGILHVAHETSSYINSPLVQELYRTKNLQAQGHDLEKEHTSQSENLSGARKDGLYLKNLLAVTSPIKGHTINYSLPSNFPNSNVHLLNQNADVIGQNATTQTVHSEDAHQLPVEQSISGHTLNSDWVYKFQTDCNIPEHTIDGSSFLVFNRDKCTNIQDEVASLALSPRNQSQTAPSDKICNCQSLATCDTNMTDFIASQIQNDFITPQKSSPLFNSNCEYFLKHRQWKDTSGHDVPREARIDEKCLQNVRRNLFSDLTTNELSSPLPSFEPNILNQDLLDMSSSSSSGNLPSQNLSQTSITLDNQGTELQPQMWSSSFVSAPCQPIVPIENTTSAVQSQLTRIIPSQSTSTVPLKSSPVKAPNIVKTVIRYSTPKQGQDGTLAFPVQLDASFINNSTQTGHPSMSQPDNDDFFHSSMSSKSTSNSNFSNAVMPVSKQETQKSAPDFSSSPKKSALVRKIANLSPLKMSSKEVDECSGLKNPVIEPSKRMQHNFVDYDHSISPIKSSSISGTTVSKKTANYFITQAYQSPIKPTSDPRTFRRTTFNAPLMKEFPTFSREAGKWVGLDLPLTPHVRNSLDVSSDGCSSPPSSASDVICQVFVPYTGWALFYATGTVWILYNDGTQLGVNSTEASMIYIDQDGSRKRYTNSDVVPEIVKLKLAKLPKVIDMLMKSQAAASIGDML